MAQNRCKSCRLLGQLTVTDGDGQVDCRRTDRTQSIFAVPPDVVQKGEEEKEAGGAGTGWDGVGEAEEGGMAGLNSECWKNLCSDCVLTSPVHVAALRSILMTYHTQHPALGYVQGTFTRPFAAIEQTVAECQGCPTC